MLFLQGRLVSVPHLSQDLILPQDHGVKATAHLKKVCCGSFTAVYVQVFEQLLLRNRLYGGHRLLERPDGRLSAG